MLSTYKHILRLYLIQCGTLNETSQTSRLGLTQCLNPKASLRDEYCPNLIMTIVANSLVDVESQQKP